MAHLSKSDTSGHLLKNTSGHLVNDCGCIEYSLTIGDRIDGAGLISPYTGDGAGDPSAADYAVAFADLPDGSSPAPPDSVGFGYQWPQIVMSAAVLGAYGVEFAADTSDLATTTGATLTVSIENYDSNNWEGEVTVNVRYDTTAPAPGFDLADAFIYGNSAGTITIAHGDTETADFSIDAADIDVDGTFHVILFVDCSDDPGYPGGDTVYSLELLGEVDLCVDGTLD